MTIGEALAGARQTAGLSVEEVSERTRIREVVIRSIERDDFGPLGGDLYVRGYLRAIAGAIGVDPQPLIRELDAMRSCGPGGRPADTTAAEVPTVVEPVLPAPAEAPAGVEATVVGLAAAEPAADPGPPADSGVRSAGSGSVADSRVGDTPASATHSPAEAGAAEVTLAEEAAGFWDAFSWEPSGGEPYLGSWDDDAVADPDPVPTDPPLMPGVWELPATQVTSAAAGPEHMAGSQPSRASAPRASASRVSASRVSASRVSASRVRGPRWMATISVLTVVVLAIVAVAGIEIASKLHSAGKASAATGSATTATVSSSATVRPSALASGTPAAVAPTPTSAVPPRVPIQRLTVASAEAFGPSGVGDGDNPQYADDAITAGATRPWRTNWYTTADFGRLQHGTGLLLSMGKRVTVSEVHIQLGGNWGANVQIRAGNDLSDLPVLASATNTGGLVTLRLTAPVRARYVLIWFTRLPPDGSGTYQASVYGTTILGRP